MQERMSLDLWPSIPCLPRTEITSVTQTKVSPCGVQTSAVLSSPPWRRVEFSSLWSEFTLLALLVANTMAERQCDFWKPWLPVHWPLCVCSSFQGFVEHLPSESSQTGLNWSVTKLLAGDARFIFGTRMEVLWWSLVESSLQDPQPI